MNDPISDMLTRIRNGQRARLAQISCPASNVLRNILEVLKREGYIRDIDEQTDAKGHRNLEVTLKYHDGQPVIQSVNRISTPGRRVYSGVETLPRVCNGLGIAIISTSKGVMSDYEARINKVGGEVLCEVA
jgi:small subunit ribosomal protein S8